MSRFIPSRVNFKPVYEGNDRLGDQILINDCKYVYNNHNSYRCSICKASAVVKVEANRIVGVLKMNPHVQAMHEKYKKKQISAEAKENICLTLLEDPTARPTSVTRAVDSKTLSDWKKKYKKNNGIPIRYEQLVPSNREKDIYPLILAHDGVDCIIYGQSSGLFILSLSDIILIDGTFNVTNNEGQLLIIHGLLDKQCYSCLFIRMSRKTDKLYQNVYKMVQHLGRERGLNIFNRTITIKGDYESANIGAIAQLFPRVVFSGYYFHYSYNIMKKMKKIGLESLYENSLVFKTLVRRIRALCIIPKKFVNDVVLNAIFHPFEANRVNADNKLYKKFKEYLYRTWLGDNARYNVNLWNVSDIEIRTNNYSETVHKGINERIHKRVEIAGMIQIIQDIIEEDELKAKGIKKPGGRKTTPFINNIIKF